jgi:hypothetical protein
MPLINMATQAWPAWLKNPVPRLGKKAAFFLASATALISVALSRLASGSATAGIMWVSAAVFRGTHSLTVFLWAGNWNCTLAPASRRHRWRHAAHPAV